MLAAFPLQMQWVSLFPYFPNIFFKGMTWTSFIVSGLCVILMDLHSFGEKKKHPHML